MNRYKSLFVASVVFVLVGCAGKVFVEEDININNEEVVFYARFENGPKTKTILNSDGSISWKPGDAIKLFYGDYGPDGPSSIKLTSTNTENARIAEFRGTAGDVPFDGGWCYAIYPYAEETTFMYNTFQINLPTTQVAVPDTFDNNLFISFAISNTNQLYFYNVCGGVRFSVTQEGIKSVTLRGGGNMAGQAQIFFNQNNLPEVWTMENTWDVTLTAPDGETLQPGKQYYIVCYPEVLPEGYTLILTKEDGSQAFKKNTKPVEIKRSTFGVLREVDKDLVFKNTVAQKEIERDALIELYNAGDGDKWGYSNWCSDLPLYEWSGIEVNELGLVQSLRLSLYHGEIPSDAIAVFSELEELHIGGELSGRLPETITGLSNLRHISFVGDSGWLFDEGLEGDINYDWSQLNNLESLIISGQRISGPIPESFSQLKNLKRLFIDSNNITGGIPNSIGELSQLEELSFTGNLMEGELPHTLSNLTSLKIIDLGGFEYDDERAKLNHKNNFSGDLSFLSELSSLEVLRLSFNGFGGSIPDGIWDIPNLKVLDLRGNAFEGSLSPSIGNSKSLTSIRLGNNLLSGELPDELWSISTLESIDLTNSYTVGDFSLSNFNHFTGCISNKISSLKNLGSFRVGSNDFSGPIPETIIELENLTQLFLYRNNLTGTIPEGMKSMDNLMIFDCQYNRLSGAVSADLYAAIQRNGWSVSPQQDGYDLIFDMYSSSDYTMHEVTRVLQAATIGNGIDIVLVGDAYTDRDIESGEYDQAINLMYDALFSIEPFKSFKDYFNVYELILVSKNGTDLGDTALGITSDVFVGWDFSGGIIREYVHSLLPETDYDDIVISIVTKVPSGRSNSNGVSNLANVCVSGAIYDYNEDYFRGVVQHETIGHTFGKLADEYFYGENSVFSEELQGFLQQYHENGYYMNVDTTGDYDKVIWKKFLTIPAYDLESIGTYEGGLGFDYGVWRPTPNSIMRSSSSCSFFNAPSREAIYKRIHQLAFGDEWEYDFEEFLAWDAKNLQSAEPSKSIRFYQDVSPLSNCCVHF